MSYYGDVPRGDVPCRAGEAPGPWASIGGPVNYAEWGLVHAEPRKGRQGCAPTPHLGGVPTECVNLLQLLVDLDQPGCKCGVLAAAGCICYFRCRGCCSGSCGGCLGC